MSASVQERTTLLDPVCGMTVDPGRSLHTALHDGARYHFCSAGCRQKYVAEPARWLDRGPPPEVAPGAVHTCPMHPEVRELHPGACPICGMALEPVSPTADAGGNRELADMTRRFWLGLSLAVPVVGLEMIGHPGLSAASSRWIALVCASAVVGWAGRPFLERGWASVVRRSPNMFTLIALGVGVGWLFSVAITLFPTALPAAYRMADGSAPVYFEAASVITVLALLGQVMELRARERTGDAVRSLLRLAPKQALLVREDGRDEAVALARVAVGDRLRVRPGEQVPVDGEVLEGASTIDEALVTGEPLPIAKAKGAHVIGGTLNCAGGFVMRASQVGGDTVLARIVQLVADAQRSRAPVQRVADRVAAWFVPVVMAAAAATFLAWWLLGPPPSLALALTAAVAVLIIACPCALGLATPMSIMVGVGRGAGMGVLIRDAATLERMTEVDTLLLDKTGTLTVGQPRVIDIRSFAGSDEGELLALAAALERGSEHPLAAAVMAAAEERALTVAPATEFAASAGQGVSAVVAGRRIVLGNDAMLRGEGVDLAAAGETAEELRRQGASIVWLAADGRLAGLLAIADPIKDSTAEAVGELKASGLRLVMVTGDHATTARAVARQLGIDEIEAAVTPEGKRALVLRLKDEGRIVAVAGDGINDAPALATADVGIAMGTGADVALESAGITLVGGDLRGIVRARRLSRATMRNIRQNLFWAFAYNALGVPLAAGILYPLTGFVVGPMVAAVAMALSSVSVIGNALRLRSLRL